MLGLKWNNVSEKGHRIFRENKDQAMAARARTTLRRQEHEPSQYGTEMSGKYIGVSWKHSACRWITNMINNRSGVESVFAYSKIDMS